MSARPFTDGVALTRAALASALAPLVGTYEGLPKAYWLQAPELAPRPLLVYQSQDGGGRDDSFLSYGGFVGLYTIKALAESADAADTLLATVPPVLVNLAVAGYGVTTRFVRALVLPPRDFVHQVGLIYQISLYE